MTITEEKTEIALHDKLQYNEMRLQFKEHAWKKFTKDRKKNSISDAPFFLTCDRPKNMRNANIL
jgi:hypothetical protein